MDAPQNDPALPEPGAQIYRNLFEFSSTPTALFDSKGRCRLANRAFLLQLGYDPTDFDPSKTEFRKLFPDGAEGAQLFDWIRRRGVVRRREARLVTAEGDVFTALLSGRTLEVDGDTHVEISFVHLARAEQLARQLRRHHTRLASLIEHLAAGVFLVDRKGDIVEANAALGRLLDQDPEKFTSAPYIRLFARMISMAAEPEVLQQSLDRAALNVVDRPEVEFTIEGDPLQFIEVTLFPVRDAAGAALGWGGLVQDITEVRAQTAWKLELLSILSHDIRSPLATLKGHATALLTSHSQWSQDMVGEFLEAINREVDRLTHQVDRNLALTRVETGRLGLRPERCEPALLVEQSLERAAGVLEDREVRVEISEMVPQVRADPARIEETLVNLLENAARYAPASEPITVTVRSVGDWVQFSVIDGGPGIPPDRQAAIFEKYVRGESEGGGTGLGLYISRRIVEAHGGKIRVVSPPPEMETGSAFSFTLPVLAEVEQPEREPAVPGPELEAGGRVLVVEDESDFQAVLRSVLVDEGYQVEVAPDGTSALDIVRTSAPDIVLLDWVLPGMDGLQVCRGIRRWSNVPIIMVTSRTAQEDIIAAFDVGVDDYIVKPFSGEELLVRMRALLRRGEPGPAADEQADRLTVSGLTIDFGLQQVFVGGREVRLTASEMALLTYLARHPRQVLTYDQIMDHLWPDGDGTRHGLSVHASRLRKKIEADPENPEFIQTRWGIGYVFAPEARL